MKQNNQSSTGGLNQLNSAQWAEYWKLKEQNDADARRDFWRSLVIAMGIALPIFVCLCIFAK